MEGPNPKPVYDGFPSWPSIRGPARPKMATGWKCGDCGTVLAPWVASHTCRTPADEPFAPPGYMIKADPDDTLLGVNSTATAADDGNT